MSSLPKKYQNVLIPLISAKTTEDQFHDMVVCCYEEDRRSKQGFFERTKKAIEAKQKEQQREANAIYNPYRNISFNQSYGDSDVPASVWLKLPGQDEWADPLTYEDD